MSLFDKDGKHGRDIALRSGLLNVVDLLPDGEIFTHEMTGTHGGMTGTSGLVRNDVEWGILAADATIHATLGEYPGYEAWATFGTDGRIESTMFHPFGRTTLGAVWGDLVAVGVQDSYEIKAFAANGSLVRVIRRDGDPGSPTRADQNAYYERRYANLPDDRRASNLKAVKDMPLVDSYPAFAGILSDRAGYLWVREYRVSGEGDAVLDRIRPRGAGPGPDRNPARPGRPRDRRRLRSRIGRGRPGRGIRAALVAGPGSLNYIEPESLPSRFSPGPDHETD